jgi:hypothetical protein
MKMAKKTIYSYEGHLIFLKEVHFISAFAVGSLKKITMDCYLRFVG